MEDVRWMMEDVKWKMVDGEGEIRLWRRRWKMEDGNFFLIFD
ncbi:MAG: hypothetical protein U5J96_03435 [Ignavibacteriaceae bacterium]|nr:hypothetical protein [Ignavibacteriaceae bacterium]